MRKTFDTIKIHTLIRKLLQTNIPGTMLLLIANQIKGCKTHTSYRNHTHPYKVNLKLALLKVACSHPHYLTFTPQTYPPPEHRFRACLGSSDSSLHVVELPRGRSFFCQIGVISSIQDLRQVDRVFFGVESVVRGNADSLIN